MEESRDGRILGAHDILYTSMRDVGYLLGPVTQESF